MNIYFMIFVIILFKKYFLYWFILFILARITFFIHFFYFVHIFLFTCYSIAQMFMSLSHDFVLIYGCSWLTGLRGTSRTCWVIGRTGIGRWCGQWSVLCSSSVSSSSTSLTTSRAARRRTRPGTKIWYDPASLTSLFTKEVLKT